MNSCLKSVQLLFCSKQKLCVFLIALLLSLNFSSARAENITQHENSDSQLPLSEEGGAYDPSSIPMDKPFAMGRGAPDNYVNASDGSANFSIPINVPEGRAGLTPQLELSYSSNSSRSHFGVGWELMPGKIERFGARFAVPSYDSSDVFLINMPGAAGRLVLDPDGVSTHFRTEKDSLVQITKNEASNQWTARMRDGRQFTFGGTTSPVFTRDLNNFANTYVWMLTSVEDLSGNKIEITWQSDNQVPLLSKVDYFGRSVEFIYEDRPTADIRLDFSKGTRMKMSKRLSQILVKNLVNPSYPKIISGLQSSYNELDRSPGNQYADETNSYLTSVLKLGNGGAASAEPPWQFHYTKRSGSWYEDSDWKLPQVMSYFDDNSGLAHDTGLRFADVNGDALPDLIIRGEFDSLTQSNGDPLNGGSSAYNDEIFINTGNGWSSSSFGSFPLSISRNLGSNHRAGGIPLDLDGDGRAEAISSWWYAYYDPEQYPTLYRNWVQRNLGSGWNSLPSNPLILNHLPMLIEVLTSAEEWGRQLDYGTRFPGDLNGDGLGDIVQLCNIKRSGGGPAQRCADINGTAASGVYLGQGIGNNGNEDYWQYTYAGDVNIPQAAQHQDVTFNLSFSDYHYENGYYNTFSTGLFLADMNADGLPDLVESPTNGTQHPTNNGVGKVYFNHDGKSFNADSEFPWSGIIKFIDNGHRERGIEVGDFDADGLQDYLYRNDAEPNSKGFYRNIGNGFELQDLPEYMPPLPVYSGMDGARSVDIDGDGLLDLVQSYRIYNPSGASTEVNKVFIAYGDVPGLLNKAVLPTGANISFTHGVSTQKSLHSWNENSPKLAQLRNLVSQVSIDDTRGNLQTTSFKYYEGYFDTSRREFRGFKRVSRKTNTAGASQRAVDSWYDQDLLATNGQIEYEVQSVQGCSATFDPSNPANLPSAIYPISWKQYQYNTTITQAPYWSPLGQQTSKSFQNGDPSKALDTTSQYLYDACNSSSCKRVLTEERHYGSDEPTASNQSHEWLKNTSQWLFVPCRNKLKSANRLSGAAGATILTDEFYYPGVNNVCSGTPTSALLSRQKTFDSYSTRNAYFNYDSSNGNLLCVSSSNGCGGARKTIFTYDSEQAVLLTSISDANNLTTETHYDQYLRPDWTKAPNGVKRDFYYDQQNRLDLTKYNGEFESDLIYYNDARRFERVLYTVGTNKIHEKIFRDGLGREYYRESWTDDDPRVRCSGKTFDGIGRVMHDSLPIMDTELCNWESFDAQNLPGSTYSYDQLDQVSAVIQSDGATTTISRVLQDNVALGDGSSLTVLRSELRNTNGTLERTDYTDARGRVRKVVEETLSEKPISLYDFNLLGNLTAFTDHDANVSNSYFNGFGERVAEADPDTSNCSTPYNCRWQYTRNEFGDVSLRTDAKGQQLKYHYNSAGQLQCIDALPHAAGPSTCDCYNTPDPQTSQGRNVFPTLKDSCFWYGTSNGQLNAERITKEANSSGLTNYGYDVYGNINSEDSWICLPTNANADQAGENFQVECRHLVSSRDFDLSGLVLSTALTHQAGVEILGFNYDTRARLGSVLHDGVVRIHSIGYNDTHGLGEMNSYVVNMQGHTLRHALSFYDLDQPDTLGGPSFRLRRSTTTREGGTDDPKIIQDLGYSYDALGNINKLSNYDQHGATSDYWNYSYDGNQRLKQASLYAANTISERFDYKYAPIGNLFKIVRSDYQYNRPLHEDQPNTQMRDNHQGRPLPFEQAPEGLGGDCNVQVSTTQFYFGDGQAGPHAATGDSSGAAYSYDLNGNMTDSTSRRMQYDARNLLVAVLEGNRLASRYFYDSFGDKVGEVHYSNCTPNLSGNCTPTGVSSDGLQFSFNAFFEERGTNVSSLKGFVLLPGMNGRTSEILASNNTIQNFFVKDHLGSVRVVLGNSANQIDKLSYNPFGSLREGFLSLARRFGFNGEAYDLDAELYDLGARYQDPNKARFVMADSVVPHRSDPQSWNRYAFVRNDPLNRIDPSGHDDEPVWHIDDNDQLVDQDGNIYTLPEVIITPGGKDITITGSGADWSDPFYNHGGSGGGGGSRGWGGVSGGAGVASILNQLSRSRPPELRAASPSALYKFPTKPGPPAGYHHARIDGLTSQEVVDNQNAASANKEREEKMEQWYKDNPEELAKAEKMSRAVRASPYLGEMVSIDDAISGTDAFTFQELDGEERARRGLSGAAAIVTGPVGKAAKVPGGIRFFISNAIKQMGIWWQ